MKKRRSLKKILLISFSTLVLLFIVLCIHIYVMMKPKMSDKTIALARIDFKQDINQTDADKISTWLYSQKGVQHVTCNQKANNAVFSFYPAKVNATTLTNNLSNQLHYSTVRFMPTQKDMAKSCPVMAGSFSGKVYSIMDKIF